MTSNILLVEQENILNLQGYIYLITNNINKKVYIGQTRSEIQIRFKEHLSDSRSNNEKHRNSCPYLYNAVRKYGENAFKITTLIKCDFEDLNWMETFNIIQYESTNKEKGYNISLGGNNSMVEETREKISKSLNPNGELGIYPSYKNDMHIGYNISRTINKIMYTKHFCSKKFTIIQNYIKSKLWYEKIKNGEKDDSNSYNRNMDLPQNILAQYHSNKIVGFHFCFQINGNVVHKSYINSIKSMKVKLELALKYKEEIYKSNNLKIDDDEFNFKIGDSDYNIIVKDSIHILNIIGDDALKVKKKQRIIDLPTNMKATYILDKIVGFHFCLRIYGKKYEKSYNDSKKSMKERFELALKYKEEIYKENNLKINDNEFNFKIGDSDYNIIVKDSIHILTTEGKDALKIEDRKRNKKIDKKINLPVTIRERYNLNKIIGFHFCLQINGKKFNKSYTHKMKSLKEKLELILKYKEEIYKENSLKIEDNEFNFRIGDSDYNITVKDSTHIVSVLYT